MLRKSENYCWRVENIRGIVLRTRGFKKKKQDLAGN
jgi:hypothetical protein